MTPRVEVRIPVALRTFTGDAATLEVEAATVIEALLKIGATHGGVLSRVLTPERTLRRHVNLFVGERSVRDLQGLATPLAAGDVVTIVPAVAGG